MAETKRKSRGRFCISENPIMLDATGAKKYISVETKIPFATITRIFAGERRATVEQAAKLEPVMIRMGLPLTRWDFLYGLKIDENLADYAERKQRAFRRNA